MQANHLRCDQTFKLLSSQLCAVIFRNQPGNERTLTDSTVVTVGRARMPDSTQDCIFQTIISRLNTEKALRGIWPSCVSSLTASKPTDDCHTQTIPAVGDKRLSYGHIDDSTI
eukprot:765974-Hanusia_phi.AAC.6